MAISSVDVGESILYENSWSNIFFPQRNCGNCYRGISVTKMIFVFFFNKDAWLIKITFFFFFLLQNMEEVAETLGVDHKKNVKLSTNVMLKVESAAIQRVCPTSRINVSFKIFVFQTSDFFLIFYCNPLNNERILIAFVQHLRHKTPTFILQIPPFRGNPRKESFQWLCLLWNRLCRLLTVSKEKFHIRELMTKHFVSIFFHFNCVSKNGSFPYGVKVGISFHVCLFFFQRFFFSFKSLFFNRILSGSTKSYEAEMLLKPLLDVICFENPRVMLWLLFRFSMSQDSIEKANRFQLWLASERRSCH